MNNPEILLKNIAKIGKRIRSKPNLKKIEPFEHFFDKKSRILYNDLDKNDGRWNRREILTRYLLLSAVLDQGPEIGGVRLMTTKVINNLYRDEIRIFHRPIDFFKEIGVVIDSISDSHESVKKIRAALWAKENESNPEKYNLFMDNSKQILNYAIFRWGVPLSVPLLLEKDDSNLVSYLEKWPSAEVMSRELKDNERYGLGKAIGDKAAHLFAKWYIQTFNIVKNKDNSWGKLSFELPLDSNAGRVLFRSGYLLTLATLKDFENWEVIQKKQGKGKKHYIRVTNLRGKKSAFLTKDSNFLNKYTLICRDYLKTSKNPRSVQIQQTPNVFLLNSCYGIGDLDDGLIYIGTKFCFNIENPKCYKCPLNRICRGYKKDKNLIRDYRT